MQVANSSPRAPLSLDPSLAPPSLAIFSGRCCLPQADYPLLSPLHANAVASYCSLPSLKSFAALPPIACTELLIFHRCRTGVLHLKPPQPCCCFFSSTSSRQPSHRRHLQAHLSLLFRATCGPPCCCASLLLSPANHRASSPRLTTTSAPRVPLSLGLLRLAEFSRASFIPELPAALLCAHPASGTCCFPRIPSTSHRPPRCCRIPCCRFKRLAESLLHRPAALQTRNRTSRTPPCRCSPRNIMLAAAGPPPSTSQLLLADLFPPAEHLVQVLCTPAKPRGFLPRAHA